MTTFRERWKLFKLKKLESLQGSLTYNGVKARHEHTGLEIDRIYGVIAAIEQRLERLENDK